MIMKVPWDMHTSEWDMCTHKFRHTAHMHVFCIELFMVVDVYKARMNMPILNREYSDAMRNLSSTEAQALAVPLCTEVYYIHFYRITKVCLFWVEILEFLHVHVYNMYKYICTYAYQGTKILHLEAWLVTLEPLLHFSEVYLTSLFRGNCTHSDTCFHVDIQVKQPQMLLSTKCCMQCIVHVKLCKLDLTF